MTRFFRLMALFLILPAVAYAQSEDHPGVTSYPAAYFQANQPATALDMVALLPGFRLEEGDTTIRGFTGAAGNVLIDGILPASKEDDAQTALQRIPAASVDHIELIRSGAQGVNLHGYALVANVVRGKTASLRGRIEIEDAFNHYGLSAPRVGLHLTRQTENDTLDLSATVGREINGNHGFGTLARFAGDGLAQQLANYDQPELKNFSEGAAQYRWGLLGGQADLNFVGKQEVEYSDVAKRIIFPEEQVSFDTERKRTIGFEATLHYERPLGTGGRWQLFASHRANGQDNLSRSTDSSGTDLSQSQRGTRETIFRSEAHVDDGALALEVGAEGAVNMLDSKNVLEDNGIPVILPASNVRVEERRAEFFATGTWRFNPSFTLELGTHYEISTIAQSGDTNLTKNLSFLKPRLLASWRFAPGQELRLLAERQVGQLDFDNFVSSANLLSGNISAGNPNLLPDRTMRLELTWEHHYWDRGSLTLTVQRDSIAGLLDHIPVTVNGTVFDATGNIGSGRRDEIDATLTLPLDRISLAGVTLQANATIQHSKTKDLVTGMMRRFSGGEPLSGSVSLTHDLPLLSLRWGMSFKLATQETDYRIDEIDARHHVSHLNAFVEYKPSPSWTIRLFGQDLAQSAYVRDRLIYNGLRSAVPIDYEERRALNNGALLGLNIQFNFG